MERAKRYIWGCVLGVVLGAVIIGMFYYFLDVRSTDTVNEGILIFQMLPQTEGAGIYGFW